MSTYNKKILDHRYHYLGIGPRWIRRSVSSINNNAKNNHTVSNPEAISSLSLNPPLQSKQSIPKEEVIHGSEVSTAFDIKALKIDVSQYDWSKLESTIANCTLCPLSKTRTQTVFGIGDKKARLMIIGEAPGANEDKQGKPFVGQAGKLLDNMLMSIQLSRECHVFITNVLKCRPPQNRNPQTHEVACCSPYLTRQIMLVQPKVILAVGRYAVNALLQTEAPISSLRGKVHQYADIPIIVTYHPAYLLRNLPDKWKAWQDLLLVKKILAQ